ncbi:hypothetical protein ACGC1H_000758 [Rhizoctonia solani]
MVSRLFSRNLSRLGSLSSSCNKAALARPISTRSPSVDPEDDRDLTEKIRPFGTYIPVLSENPLQQGTSHIPRKDIPAYIPRPAYAHPNYKAPRPPPYRGDGLIKLGTADEVKARRAGALAAMALQTAESLVKPGITSEMIDDQVHDFILSHGAYPSPLNYVSFPRPKAPTPKVHVLVSTTASYMVFPIPENWKMVTSSTLMSQYTSTDFMAIRRIRF